MTRGPLTTECAVETYNIRGWPCSGLDNVGKCWKYWFRSSKAFCCSGSHLTFVEPHSTLKKGRLPSTSFTMNLFSAAIRPSSFCTSFLVYGGCIWRIVFILTRLASMPLVDTKQPNTLPRVTLKTHFSGLSLTWLRAYWQKFPSGQKYTKLFSCLLLRCHRHKRICFYRLGPLVPPLSFYKTWVLRFAAPPTFSCSNMCQMVLRSWFFLHLLCGVIFGGSLKNSPIEPLCHSQLWS
jgi:hypothetical protein